MFWCYFPKKSGGDVRERAFLGFFGALRRTVFRNLTEPVERRKGE
jgi:hypothetical protein